MIAIIDYQMGNLRSVQKAFEKVGYEAVVTHNLKAIDNASGVVLPGVGAFRDAMKHLEEFDLINIIHKSIASGKPFLGICLGLHLLFSESEEFGITKGLDIIKGKVERFSNQLKVPHMGWNNIQKEKENLLLSDIPDQSFMYFVHSYYVKPVEDETIVTTTDYGIRFTSMICKDNIFATQFHPEKSQTLGLKILKRFGELTK